MSLSVIDRINQTPELKALCEGGDFAGAAALMQSDKRTVKPISLTDLMFVMNFRGMLTRLIRPSDNGEKWSGTVVNMVTAVESGGNTELIAAVQQWFSHITNDRNQTFDTTRQDYANLFYAIRMAVADSDGMPASADFDAVIALGGGYANQPTAMQIEDAWYAQITARKSGLVQDAWLAVQRQITHETTRDEVLAAFNAALSEVWV